MWWNIAFITCAILIDRVFLIRMGRSSGNLPENSFARCLRKRGSPTAYGQATRNGMRKTITKKNGVPMESTCWRYKTWRSLIRKALMYFRMSVLKPIREMSLVFSVTMARGKTTLLSILTGLLNSGKGKSALTGRNSHLVSGALCLIW